MTLGTNGGTRSKSLIRNQSHHSTSWCPEKKEEKQMWNGKRRSSFIFSNLLQPRTRTLQLQVLVYMISEHDDQCTEILNSEDINDYYSWFSKHLLEYQVLIHSILIQNNA